MTDHGTTRERATDFDVHGIVGVRLLDAAPADRAAVRRQLGPLEAPLDRAPDVVVRFVDELPATDLRFVELGRTGFTDDRFVVLEPHDRAPRAAIAFDAVGERCEILCRGGGRAVPFLLPVVMLTALGHGYVPLHASAFEYRGAGVVAAGWAHGGKTSALLAFARQGAGYVADDLVLLRADGGRMFGLPTALELWDWQVAELPAAARRVSGARRVAARAVRGLAGVGALLPRDVPADARVRRLLWRASSTAQRRLRMDVPLELAFEDRVPLTARPRTIFLTISHAEPTVRVEAADPGLLAERLALSLQQELLGFTGQYLAWRFAFPDRRNALVEGAPAMAAELLRGALADKEVYVVRHPYPPSLAELYRAMRPHCGAPHPVVG